MTIPIPQNDPAPLQVAQQDPIERNTLAQAIGYATRRSRIAGLVYDDAVLQELSGLKARTTLARMAADPIIAGIVERMRLIMRSAVWTIRPGGKEDLDKELADFCQDGLEQIDGGFQAVMGSSATKIVWGFSLFEQVLKHLDNGDWTWAAFLPRDQQTIYDWKIEPHTGRLQIAYQYTDDGYSAALPAWKLLHFRTEPLAGRPEGRPLVRNAYLAWVDKQELRRIVKVGVRRDLVGLPVATAPIELLNPNANPEEQATLGAITDMLEEVEQDQRAFIVFPSDTDKDGNPTGWKLELMKSPGSRQLKLEEIWSIFDRQIAISMMSEVVLYGTDKVGSYALADVKTSTIAKAAGAWMDDDAEHMRTRPCRLLQLLNPRFAKAKLPIWDHGPLDPITLNDLANFIGKVSVGGHLTPDPNLENELRRKAELPVLVAEGDRTPPIQSEQDGAPGKTKRPRPKPAKQPQGDGTVDEQEV